MITRLRALFKKQTAAIEPVDLNAAAREVIALSLAELHRHGVAVRVDLAEGLPFVSGDRVQLQQVILNLILNALDAMSDVGDGQRQLVVRTELDGRDKVLLSVQDSGLGLDTESASRIFDAFFTTKPGGMGIGLSVSRSIIESHQGRLWARPNEKAGSTFAFSLPGSVTGTASHSHEGIGSPN